MRKCQQHIKQAATVLLERPGILSGLQLLSSFWDGEAIDRGVIHKPIEVYIHPDSERPQPGDDAHGARAADQVYHFPADLFRGEQHKSRCGGICLPFNAGVCTKLRGHTTRVDHRDVDTPWLDLASQRLGKSMHGMLTRGVNCVRGRCHQSCHGAHVDDMP